MRTPILTSKLEQFIGAQISEEILLGRNYFLGSQKLEKYNSHVDLTDFPKLKDPKDLADCLNDEGAIRLKKDVSSISIMRHVAATLTYYDEVFDKDTDGYTYWHKCMPTNEEDICKESYIIIRIAVDEFFKIRKIKANVRYIDNEDQFYVIPKEEKCWLKSDYTGLPFVTPEVFMEVFHLTACKFLPKDFSFIGKQVNDNMRESLDLDCGNKSEYIFGTASGFTDTFISIILTVDNKENNTITGIDYDSESNGRSMKSYSKNADKLDIMDCLIQLHDYL